MDFSAVCRTCLHDGELNSIFLDTDDKMRFSHAIFVITGVKVTPDDGLPQKMCINCIEFLNKSLKFRKTCREVAQTLLSLKNQLETPESVTEVLEENESSFEQDKAKIFVKIEPLSKTESRIMDINQIKMEYTDYEVLDEMEEDDSDIEESDINTEILKKEIFLIDNHEETNIKITEAKPTEAPYISIQDSAEYKPRRVTCRLCQKDLSIRSVDDHMARSHPGADQRKVKCELCDRFINKQKIKRHLKQIHGTENSMRCGYCKSEFNSKEMLIQHIVTCTAKKKQRMSKTNTKLIECDVCHKTMQKGSLRLHKAVKHAGLGPVCEHCGRRFSNKLRLSEHYRAKHGYEKFKCDLCDFESSSHLAMQNHSRRHRGDKPFVCVQCDAAFHAAYLLAQHRQSHATDRLVQCKLCPAKFKATNSLHMHKLSCHSGAIYKCTLCSKTYGSRQYTVKHMRHTHKYTGPIPELQKVDAEPSKEG